jgi:hypothetical protein
MNGAPTHNVPPEGAEDVNAAAAVTPDFIRIVSSGSSDAGGLGPPSPPRAPRRTPPRIAEPHPTNDALCGRGGQTNNHQGHKLFLKHVRRHLPEYEAAPKLGKRGVAVKVVMTWRAQDPPGRFVKYDQRRNRWIDVGDETALAKVYQAFRDEKEGRKGGKAKRAAKSAATNGGGSDDFEPMVSCPCLREECLVSACLKYLSPKSLPTICSL